MNAGGRITEGFCVMKDKGLFLLNAHIAPYLEGTVNNQPPLRERQLLLKKKKELRKIGQAMEEKGVTVVIALKSF